jgi:hypothetical protein
MDLRLVTVLAFVCFISISFSAHAPSALADEDLDFFERKIRPVLVEKCYGCHSIESGKSKGGLRVDTKEALRKGGESGPGVVERDLTKSLVIAAINYDSFEMPPGGKLGDSVIADFEHWIHRGAIDPRLESELGTREEFTSVIDFEEGKKFWAFQPTKSALLPDSINGWGNGRIDRWIADKLNANNLTPSPAASRTVLVRRLSFDLLGLPPLPEQTEAFVTDLSEDAYQKLVDQMLNAPSFGERWARPWLDLARFGEDQAHIVGNDRSLCFPNAYLYRDWLIRALNDDVPYDEFIRLQLAADLMYPAEEEHLPALGFMGLGPKYYRRNAPEVMAEEWEDRVDVLSRGLLGLTIACARCHDHKFDPIGTEDYYALAGVFASTEMFNRPVQSNVEMGKDGHAKDPANSLHVVREATPTDLHVMIRGDVQRKGPIVPRRFVKVLSPDSIPVFDQGSGRLQLAQAITDPSNPVVARVFVNRVWQALFGRGLVKTASNFGKLGEQPTHPELLDDLSNRFIENGWSTKWLIREMVLSETYRQSSEMRSECESVDATNALLWRMNRKRLSVESWRDAILSVCGKLDSSIGGKSIDPSHPESRRKTIYSEVSRLGLNRMLAVFDFPDPNAHSDGRIKTINPLQKLFVMNSPFMLATSASLRQRVDSFATHPADRVRATYQLLFARQPSHEELSESLEFLQGESPPWVEWAQVLLATNEFATLD